MNKKTKEAPVTFHCKTCGGEFATIIVESKCTQTLTLAGNDYHDLEVHESVGGLCPGCGARINLKTVRSLEEKSAS